MIITATGMVCPVGLTARASCAALRAGISAFGELPYWDCEKRSVIGAQVPGLGERQFGDRLVAMLAPALHECMMSVPDTRWQNVPLIVGLPELDRPGGAARISSVILSRLQLALRVEFHPQFSEVITSGHTSGFMGLGISRQLLNSSSVPGCLVCAVDSYINASTIWWLDQTYRLKRENHMDGLVPGEAAAAVFLEQHQASQGVNVVGLGFGRERAHLLCDEPLMGNGLADAARAALGEAGWGFHDIDFRVADVTGETYGFREHTLVEARLVTTVRIEPQPIWHAADCIGDTGAAAGVVQLAWVAAAMQKGYAPGPRTLCFTSSLGGSRAVAALQRDAVSGGLFRS
jgi:3-oxoacyl-[acyl-carrier-protein] synthase-1